MTRYWIIARDRVGSMSLRERAIVFAACSFVLVALISELLLAPLLDKQKALSLQVGQQQERMKEQQAQMQALLQARSDDENSPLRQRLNQLKERLQEQAGYLDARREHLVEPSRIAELLGQVLNQNAQVQLVELKTLPVSALVEKPKVEGAVQPASANGQRQIFKHGVQITVRGSYLDLLRYTSALEHLPTQMFWGEASLSVEQYPAAVLTLTVFTLSLDKMWLTI